MVLLHKDLLRKYCPATQWREMAQHLKIGLLVSAFIFVLNRHKLLGVVSAVSILIQKHKFNVKANSRVKPIKRYLRQDNLRCHFDFIALKMLLSFS